jgi:hypothetical protein
MTTNQPPLHTGGRVSTIFDKIDEKQRQEIDTAIIKRRPRTLVGIYDKFKLAKAGVAYFVFYRYARKVRDEANKTAILDATLADEIDVPAALAKMISRQCLDAVVQGESSPLDTHRLTLAFHKSLQVIKTLREIQKLERPPLPAAEKVDPDDLTPRWPDGQPVSDREYHEGIRQAIVDAYGADFYPSSPAGTEPDSIDPLQESGSQPPDVKEPNIAAPHSPDSMASPSVNSAEEPKQDQIAGLPSAWNHTPPRQMSSRDQYELDKILAPWGRRKDGTPRTQQELNDGTEKAVVEIYGADFYPDCSPQSLEESTRVKEELQRRLAEEKRAAAIRKLRLDPKFIPNVSPAHVSASDTETGQRPMDEKAERPSDS